MRSIAGEFTFVSGRARMSYVWWWSIATMEWLCLMMEHSYDGCWDLSIPSCQPLPCGRTTRKPGENMTLFTSVSWCSENPVSSTGTFPWRNEGVRRRQAKIELTVSEVKCACCEDCANHFYLSLLPQSSQKLSKKPKLWSWNESTFTFSFILGKTESK